MPTFSDGPCWIGLLMQINLGQLLQISPFSTKETEGTEQQHKHKVVFQPLGTQPYFVLIHKHHSLPHVPHTTLHQHQLLSICDVF